VPVTTPSFSVTPGSLDLVFVSYINELAGGGSPQSVNDSLHDSYTLLATTGLTLNHTEALYAADVPTGSPDLTVSVTFGGGMAPQGGSVATVDVANTTLSAVDGVSWNTGLVGPANVTVATGHAGDLFLLGAAGRGVSGPYTAGAGETLLDTGTSTSGPFEDGTGYGTFSIASTSTDLTLSANLNVSTWWDAVGVAVSPATLGAPTLVGSTGLVNNNTTVVTPPIRTESDSLLLVFVSYVNSLAGGGGPVAITDSLGDSYSLVNSTGFALNHTEDLYAAPCSVATTSLTVSVSFGGGATPQGGSVAVADVGNATVGQIDSVEETTGSGPLANLTLDTSHTGDLCLFGAAGRGVSGPYSPGTGMTLLDTGTNTSGPFEDGIGYGTFSAVASGTAVALSAFLNTPTWWEAIGIAID
jgi:hypothetical protein